MFDETARKAINAALNKNWQDAVDINLSIIEDAPEDVSALNRLSQAYLQLSDLKRSKINAERVLEIDPLNVLAEKCLSKIKLLSENKLELTNSKKIAPSHFFIEEPGKTKLVTLINICEQNLLLMLTAGEYVEMVTRKPKVVITTSSNSYIGRLPDDIAYRIISLTENGKKFDTYLKSINNNIVKIFIRETYSVEGNGAISFPNNY